MPPLNNCKTQSDTLIDSIFPALAARQENYMANRNRYWQGLPTHSAIPAHITGQWGKLVADRLDTHPDDVFEDWSATCPDLVGVAIPCMFFVNAYNSTSGQGYELVASFSHNGTVYERHINVGPDTSRNSDWTAFEE